MAIVGIDLGTTNSLVSVFKDGKIEHIPNSLGEILTPSVVSFDEDGTVYVGRIAKERKITHPDTTISSFKTFMGTNKKYNIYGKDYSPEELSALIIQQLINDAKEYLKEDIKEAVISVPAYFNNKQRNATKNAGVLAEIKVERLINEPSAAAAYYYVNSNKKQTFLVFDFGGGTLDISIVDAFENIIEVVSIVGDNHLGGDDFDKKIAEEICNQNEIEWNNLSSIDKEKILKTAESCKFLLNIKSEVIVKINLENKEIEGRISKKRLIEISSDIFTKIKRLLNKILKDSGISANEIDNILLVGGSSNMKVVQEYISYITHKNLLYDYEPDMLVGLGAGLVAGIKERKEELQDIVMTDVCPFSLGISILNRANANANIFSPIIQRNTTLPVSRMSIYSTAYDNQTKLLFEVYQGENYYCSDNLKIGEIEVDVPKNERGMETADVRFTYDINGILEVEIHVISTGEIKKMYIQSDDTHYTEEEMKNKIKELNELKKDYIKEDKVMYVLELGKRLYEENIGELREAIGNAINSLEQVVNTQDSFKIRKTYERTKNFFEQLDLSAYGDVDFKKIIEEEDMEDGEDDLGDFTSRYTNE